MPEGDTVYRSARQLNAALAGEVLTKCDIRVPAFATVDLTGETVHDVTSRGKHLLMHVGEYTIHSHLKMEGSWRIFTGAQRWSRPAYLARAVLSTADVTAVGFELGTLTVVRTDEEGTLVDYLGPDLLGPDWDASIALNNLLAQPEREIGLALLDQRNLAGIGNVYRAELCFLRGMLPTRPVAEVAQLEKTVDLAHRLLEANKLRSTRATTGNLRRDSVWVYGRAGKPCFRCGTIIERGTLGDTELTLRDTWWCPRCQS